LSWLGEHRMPTTGVDADDAEGAAVALAVAATVVVVGATVAEGSGATVTSFTGCGLPHAIKSKTAAIRTIGFMLQATRFMSTGIAKLLAERRVLITVGAGGVGKTTTAAALAVAAARDGKRVLCLTIDPAKRLAESLGLRTIDTEAVKIDKKRFDAAGVPLRGELTVMMLDTKTTFDELVQKYSSSPAKAKQLLDNKLYQYVSTSLAGTQEYMAVEKLVAVKDDPRYDLVVLDTPPTTNALDFLDAPERLMDALDSSTMKWFVQAFETSGKLSLNILAKSASVVLKGIGKLTGGGFLEAMAELISELNDLFGGFKERAKIVQRTLRSKDVAFVCVTSPSPMSLREVVYFAERLIEHEMPLGAFVVNRLHMPPAATQAPASVAEARAAVTAAKLEPALGEDGAERVARAHADAFALAELDAYHLHTLDQVRKKAPLVRVAELASDVHDVGLLAQLADTLVAGGV
jgi:anion-transporting  ArsA/GET3 family ATPase